MTVMPLVSVIMPAYNAEKYISAAIRSVIDQTVTDWELIVIDDCSTDNTVQIAEQLATQDGRIKTYRNRSNFGVAASRNKALDIASGEYIAFLDSDDIWLSDKLSKQLALLYHTNADLCYTSYIFFDADGNRKKIYEVPCRTSYQRLLQENVIGCSTVLLRKNCLPQQRFSSNFFHEDYVLWLSILKNGNSAVGIEEALVLYREGGRSFNKIDAAKMRWKIYRRSEKLSLLYAGYCFCQYCTRGLCKHWRL